jgi:hypothetical protein
VVTADGQVHFVDEGRVSEQTLRAAITANAGDTVGPDF